MRKINREATLHFLTLLEKMGRQHTLELQNKPYQPLVLTQLEGKIRTSYGPATQIILYHYYLQNGSRKRDPEMGFLHVDLRNGQKDRIERVGFYPTYYQLDSMGLLRTGVVLGIEDIEAINAKEQADQAAYASSWLVNIARKGYL